MVEPLEQRPCRSPTRRVFVVTARAASKARIERAKMLVSAGLKDWAETELRYGAQNGDQPHLLAWTNVQRAPAPRADTSGLSSSERGVLVDAANGMTVIETAASRSKSPETVKTQRRSILQEPFQYNDVRTLECIITLDPSNQPVRIGQRMRVTIKQGGP